MNLITVLRSKFLLIDLLSIILVSLLLIYIYCIATLLSMLIAFQYLV
jgi:hypothetical protein